jgi:RNA polymerase sigma-70 factor (ECF subfamily)
VRAAQGGDRRALDALLRRHHDRIHAVCRRLAGNDADALDATQEALIAIARGIRRFDGRAAFSTWAYRVATNACLDELRRRGRRPTPGLPDDGAPGAPPPTVSGGIEVLPERLAIDHALAQLPEEFRAPVVLRDLCDLDYAQIAEVLGIPPGTVRSRIARGRAQLAELLRPGNQDPAPPRPTDRKHLPPADHPTP